MTEHQRERRWSSGLAGYAPPTSDLKDGISQAQIPTRWLALTHEAQGNLSLGPLRPPVMLDARSLTHAQLIGVFADLIRRSLAPAFVLLDAHQRAGQLLATCCAPIALVAGDPQLLVDWLLLSRPIIHMIPRQQLWLGLDEPLLLGDATNLLVLTLDAMLRGTPTQAVFRQIPHTERSVAQVIAAVRRAAQLPIKRQEPPQTLALRLMAGLDAARY
jgi:hypothetical protein